MFKKKNIFWTIFAVIFCLSFFCVNFVGGKLCFQNNADATIVSEVPGYEETIEGSVLNLNNDKLTESLEISGDLTINISGENSISAEGGFAFNVTGSCNLTIKGNGSLIVEADSVFNEEFFESSTLVCEDLVVVDKNGNLIDSTNPENFFEISYIKFYSENFGDGDFSDDSLEQGIMPNDEDHTHSFAVTSSGATLSAVCSAENCTLENNTISTTLTVPSVNFGESVVPAISFENFNSKTGFNVSESIFTKTYFKTQTAGSVSDGEQVGTPTNAGFYYLKLESSTDSEIGNQVLVCAFEIKKLSAEITSTNLAIDYQQDAYDVLNLFTIPENAGTVTYSVTGGTGAGTLENNLLTISRCGTIVIKATSTGTENYEASECEATLTVNKLTLSNLELEIVNWNIDLSSSPETPTVKNNVSGGEVTFKYYTDEGLSNLTTSSNGAEENGGVPNVVGVYYVKATIAETDFYKEGVCSGTFKITRNVNVTSNNPTIKFNQLTNGRYEVSQMFTFDETCGNKTYYLVLDEVNDVLITDGYIEISSIGQYTVRVVVEGVGNYSTIGITSVLTVKKSDLSITVHFFDWSYGDGPESNNPFVEGNRYNGAVTVKYFIDENCLIPVETDDGIPTEVGKYYAIVTVAETEFSNMAEVRSSVQVKPKIITINWVENDFTYNGKVQEITATYVNAKSEIVSLAVSINREFKAIGDYVAIVGFANDESNYDLPTEITKEYSIKKVELTVKVDDKKKKYLEQPNATLSAKVTFGKIIDGDDLPYRLSTTVSADSEIGKYEIIGECIDENYNIHFQNGWYYVNNCINKLFISGWTYGDEPSTPQAETYYGTIVYYYAPYIATQDFNWTTDVPTEPGQYWIKAEVIDDDETKATYALDLFTIERITVETPGEDKEKYVYNGLNQTYKVAEDPSFYTISGRTQMNAGEYKVKISLIDNVHYKWSTSQEKTIEYVFVIHRKSVQKPVKDSRVFKYNGSPITYQIASSSDYNISDNATQTEVGRYVITVSLKDLQNTEWADNSTSDIEFEFVINQNKIDNPKTVDSNGNVLEITPVTIVDTDEKGISPELKLNVTVFDLKDKQQLKNIRSIISSKLQKYDKVFRVYDVKLLDGKVVAQPNGTVSLKMAIPEELKGGKFRLFHIHTDENGVKTFTEVDYGGVDDSGFITFQTSEFSEYVFVYEQDSLVWLIATFAVLSAILIALLVVQVMHNKGKKKKSTMALAGVPVFFVQGEVIASILLGCLTAGLIATNIIMFVLAKKKKSKLAQNETNQNSQK